MCLSSGRFAGKFRHAKNFADTAGTGTSVTTASHGRTQKARPAAQRHSAAGRAPPFAQSPRPSRRPRLPRSSDKDRSGSPAALNRTAGAAQSSNSVSHASHHVTLSACSASGGLQDAQTGTVKEGPDSDFSEETPRPSQDLCRAEMHRLRVPRDAEHRREASKGPLKALFPFPHISCSSLVTGSRWSLSSSFQWQHRPL